LKGPLKFIIAILDSDNEDNDTVLSDYLDKFKTAEMNSYKDINLVNFNYSQLFYRLLSVLI